MLIIKILKEEKYVIRVIQLDLDIIEGRNLTGGDCQKIETMTIFYFNKGITLLRRSGHRKRKVFGSILSEYTPKEDLYIEKIYGYHVEDRGDKFKDVIICPFKEELDVYEPEDTIMLITQNFGVIKSFSGEQIAGRYGDDGRTRIEYV